MLGLYLEKLNTTAEKGMSGCFNFDCKNADSKYYHTYFPFDNRHDVSINPC